MAETLKIALAQASSTEDIDRNRQWAAGQMAAAAAVGTELIVFPECILLWGKPDITRVKARSLEEWLEPLAALSRQHKMAAVWGGVAVRGEEGIYNASLVIDDQGELIARYDKIHLFQLFLSDNQPNSCRATCGQVSSVQPELIRTCT